MPLYEYECDACHQRFERIQKFSDAPLEQCDKCGKGPVRKLLSSPAIQFKGSGWYVTDYARKSGASSGKTGSASDKSSSSSEPTSGSGSSGGDTAASTTKKSQ
jgi:putative FmdB family regulatory protein